MKAGLLIYGAYGYTGQLISEHAVQCGLKPVLAGRNGQKTKLLAERLQLPYRIFDLNDEQKVIENIADVKVVIHCAGPFRFTAQIMAAACIKAKTTYLDITGEYEVFEALFLKNEAAKDAGVLLMPGVGFDVVPSDCLAMYLKEKLPSAASLEMALLLENGMLSGGTAITVVENMSEGCVVRRAGKLEKSVTGAIARTVDFGDKRSPAMAIPWGDISTAYRSTGIPDITIYLCVPQVLISGLKLGNQLSFLWDLPTVRKGLSKFIKILPPGPGFENRKRSSCLIWGEARSLSGDTCRAILTLPDNYTLTAWTSVRIAYHLLDTVPPPGVLTPAQLFGSDFILQFEGVTRKVIS